METASAQDYSHRIAFEEFMAGMKKLEEFQQETSRKMEETARQMKETDRKMAMTDRRMGELYNRFGELAEHLVAPSIVEKFNELGYHFDIVSTRGQNFSMSKKKSGRR